MGKHEEIFKTTQGYKNILALGYCDEGDWTSDSAGKFLVFGPTDKLRENNNPILRAKFEFSGGVEFTYKNGSTSVIPLRFPVTEFPFLRGSQNITKGDYEIFTHSCWKRLLREILLNFLTSYEEQNKLLSNIQNNTDFILNFCVYKPKALNFFNKNIVSWETLYDSPSQKFCETVANFIKEKKEGDMLSLNGIPREYLECIEKHLGPGEKEKMETLRGSSDMRDLGF